MVASALPPLSPHLPLSRAALAPGGTRLPRSAPSCRRSTVVAPSLRCAPPSPPRATRSSVRRDGLIPAAVAVLLTLAAALVAPERPQDQEAICQRHNGVAACRVW
jgi:hypothetical protein